MSPFRNERRKIVRGVILKDLHIFLHLIRKLKDSLLERSDSKIILIFPFVSVPIDGASEKSNAMFTYVTV